MCFGLHLSGNALAGIGKLCRVRSELRNLLKNSEIPRFVKGHDFSRANKANQISGALAPEGCLPCQLSSNVAFFNKLLERRFTGFHVSCCICAIEATPADRAGARAAAAWGRFRLRRARYRAGSRRHCDLRRRMRCGGGCRSRSRARSAALCILRSIADRRRRRRRGVRGPVAPTPSLRFRRAPGRSLLPPATRLQSCRCAVAGWLAGALRFRASF